MKHHADAVPDKKMDTTLGMEATFESVHYQLKSSYHSSAYILTLIQQIMKTKDALPDISQLFSSAERPSEGEPREEQRKLAIAMRMKLYKEFEEVALSVSLI